MSQLSKEDIQTATIEYLMGLVSEKDRTIKILEEAMDDHCNAVAASAKKQAA